MTIPLWAILHLMLAMFSPEVSQKAETLIFHGGPIYTVDSAFTIAEAMAIQGDQILETGALSKLSAKYAGARKINIQGQCIYPGLIDAHSHLVGYAEGLGNVDLTGTKSWQECLARVDDYIKANPGRTWIVGRGWDQNDWEKKEFPTSAELDAKYPALKFVLKRIDGHAALVNGNVLKLARLTDTTIAGGEIVRAGGQPTGVILDNAMIPVDSLIPPLPRAERNELIRRAEQNLFAVGLTGVCEAGTDWEIVKDMDAQQKIGRLKIRIYAMLSPNEGNWEYWKAFPKPINTGRMHVCSFKFYADGALGRRGAYLLQPYADRSTSKGLLLQEPDYFKAWAKRMYFARNWQMNVHCIGDGANRVVLNAFGAYDLKFYDRRWRIEHAQIVAPSDLKKFGELGVIPSVQPTHATSDMYWAGDRLGTERLKTAYAYKDLLKAAGRLAGGSDFPVESINPWLGLYAAIERKDANGYPEGGFQMENALTPDEALRSMTIWAAYSQFDEADRGSLEAGKFADFIIVPHDLMKDPYKGLLTAKPSQTWLGGEKVFGQ